MAVEFVSISSLSVMSQYQMRVGLSDDVIDEYVSLIEGTDRQWVFADPCRVIRVGSALILVDGFHRVAAMEKAGKPAVLCDVTSGTAGDALRAALSSNAKHGARLTNADKRRKATVALEDEVIGKLSHRQIADLCGVSHEFVSQVSVQLSGVATCAPETRVVSGADGKNYPSSKDDAAKQREKIVEAIKANSKESDRSICKRIGCSPSTVAKVRGDLHAEAVEAAAHVSVPGEPVQADPVQEVAATFPIVISLDRIHPVLATIPALMPGIQAFFTADVKKYGQRYPVMVDESGVLLDGRSRVVACNALGVPVKYEIVRGTDEEKEAIVYSLNLSRRPLTMSQMAMLSVIAGW